MVIREMHCVPETVGAMEWFVGVLSAALLCGRRSQSCIGIVPAISSNNPNLQELPVRARGGDEQAQLDLGIRFETGREILFMRY